MTKRKQKSQAKAQPSKKKQVAAKVKTPKAKTESQSSFIRGRLAQKASVETILDECTKRFPAGKVTRGYIRWIAKQPIKKAKPATARAQSQSTRDSNE